MNQKVVVLQLFLLSFSLAAVAQTIADFPWLNSVLEVNNCCANQSVTVFAQDGYSYVYVEASADCPSSENKLYYEDGTCWCTDTDGTTCMDFYGLERAQGVNIYTCEGLTSYDVFDEFSWLKDLVDQEDCCNNKSVQVVEVGVHSYVYISSDANCSDGLGKIYYATGELLCADAANYNCLLAYGFSGATTAWTCGGETTAMDDGIIDFTFLQINDVYEIAALEGGKVGGMARVATIHNQLKAENPNTFFVIAGDFFNPSLIGTLREENGDRINGKQMVEVLNAANVDLAAFGNHEFDLREGDFQKRVNESAFDWIATNLLHNVEGTGMMQPFHQERDGVKQDISKTHTWSIQDADGTSLDIGFISATLNSNPQDYVVYQDWKEEATRAYQQLSGETDVVFGLTHLAVAEDMELAAMLPEIPLIMGGHEHRHLTRQVGNVSITKADANAKTAYVHKVSYNKNTKQYTIASELVAVNDQIPSDPTVQAVVDKWDVILNDNIKEVYPTPNEVVYVATEPLDGRESTIRYGQTNLGTLITTAFAAVSKQPAVAAFTNVGSIRLDDFLTGEVAAIDFFRAMPFGGQVWEVDVPGDTLSKLIQIGLAEATKGSGSFLQAYNAEWDVANEVALVGGVPVDPAQTYHIAVSDYLYWGSRLSSPLLNGLPVDQPAEGDTVDPRSDLRLAIITYLKGLE